MERPVEEVAAAIMAAHREVCRAMSLLLAEVAEHDRREGFRRAGSTSEERYLLRALDVTFPTAHGWVSVANGLVRYPELRDRFEAGEVSLDKLVGLIKLAAVEQPEVAAPLGPFDPIPAPSAEPEPGPDPGPDAPSSNTAQDAKALLDLIDQLSASQLASQARRARKAADEEAFARWRRRHCRLFGAPGEGELSMGARWFDDDAAIMRAAVEHYAANAPQDPSTGAYAPLECRYADALVQMAREYLDRKTKTTGHQLVVFHADARVLTGDGWAESADYSPLAAETIRRLACACGVTLSADDPQGRPINLGRVSRDPNWQQWVAATRRDGGGCRFCGMRFGTELHHIAWWERDKGRTDLDNLVQTCQTCHHLVHEGGYRIEGHPDGDLRLVAPDGTIAAVTHPHPPRPPDRKRKPSGSPPTSETAAQQTLLAS
jgi:hypothetical protein